MMRGIETVTLAEIYQARNRIAPYIRRTPLEFSYPLSHELGTNVYLKLENLQITGSFKPRGSLNKLLKHQPVHGVIASTAGNHGIGLAYAAQRLGIPVDIYLPTWADKQKLAKLAQYGARLTYFDTVEQARENARQAARTQELMFVSAYNDVDMIAGGGTIALEIFDECPAVDLLIVSVGGGGLAAGHCVVLKQLNAQIKIIGVQAANSPKMAHWLKEGKEVDVPLQPTIAEGLAVNMESGTITFPILQKYLDEIVLVTEAEIAAALHWAPAEHQMILEPSAAALIAAVRKLPLSQYKNVVMVLTGANIAWERLQTLLGAFPITDLR